VICIMVDTHTAEEIRQYTELPDLDATLEELGCTLEEAIQNPTNLMCGGGLPQNKRDEHRSHVPAPFYRIVNLHCLICGHHLEVRSPDESQEISEEYVLKE